MFKGVLRCYEGKRKVTIKVVDIYGHVVKFTPNDIPQLIEDLKESIDFSKNFQFIQRYGGDPDNLINVVINNPVN